MNGRLISLRRSLAAFLIVLGSASALPAAEPMLTKTDVFEAQKGGYRMYRIPGIVVTTKGTILVYCEARRHSGSDWDAIDVLMRRSTDQGKTWEEPRKLGKIEGKIERNPAAVAQKLAKPGEITVNNPIAIVDSKTGAVHFLYCVDYGRCYYMRSDDDAKTFSDPVDITAAFDAFRKDYDWKVLATGPGHGIQLKSGRLVVPVWLSPGTGDGAHRPSAVSVVYSDDHGKTWHRGGIVTQDPKTKNPSETIVVQLHDGSVLLNIRNEDSPPYRLVSISENGATGWSKVQHDKGLLEPVCMASIVRLSEQPASSKNRIVYASPYNGKLGDRARKNLTVRLSYDEAKTWPVSRLLEDGVSGYSDLAVGPDGSIYCLYERGMRGSSHYDTAALTVARFNLEWLTQGKDSLDRQQK